MGDTSVIGSIVVIAVGGIVTVTGVLAWLGRLPRNRLAGVRTRATMRSDQAFRIGNRAAAPALTIGAG